MEILNKVNPNSLIDTFISLMSAFLLGGLIGLERQYRQRTAGFRTNVLVALGASIFVDIAHRLNGDGGAVHVLAYVISGIGFLGAGVIMRGDGGIRGINTAATLWGSAAIGGATGADLILEALIGTVFILSANTLLRPVVNFVNRTPLKTEELELTIIIFVFITIENQLEMTSFLEDYCRINNLPMLDLEVSPFGEELVEIRAMLNTPSINEEELNTLISKIKEHKEVKHAYWSSSNKE